MVNVKIGKFADLFPSLTMMRGRSESMTAVPRPYVGLAWFGSHPGQTKEAIVYVRGRTFNETCVATEAAAYAIDRCAPPEPSEQYSGIVDPARARALQPCSCGRAERCS